MNKKKGEAIPHTAMYVPHCRKSTMKKSYKNLLAAAVVCMMVPAMATGAFADDTKQTTVTYSVAESYTWTVSANSVNFTANNTTADQTVSVTKNVISYGKTLKITARGDGAEGAFTIALKNTNNTNPLTYKVMLNENELSADGTVLSVPAGKNSDEAKLSLSLQKQDTEIAGEYEGHITYTATIANAE